jgi:hypothetical protein
MIFAKLDVCFWRHKKFKRAGAAACGYYAAALAYLREDETRDGILDADVVGQLLDLGEREALKLTEKLVEVGLFERCEGGYQLLRYAEKNETRDQIDTRRAATKARVDLHRQARRGTAFVEDHGPDSSCNALHPSSQGTGVTRYTTVTGGVLRTGSGSGSLSLSGSDLSEGEREREPLRESAVVPAAEPMPRETTVRLDLPRPPVADEMAAMQGVQDVPGAWTKFCGHWHGQSVDLLGKWQFWCVNEARMERTGRERAARLGSRPFPAAPEAPPETSAERAARMERETAARKAADAAYADLARAAVPMPRGLLDAVDADRAVAGRARAATTRVPSSPMSLAGTKIPRAEMSPDEREAERQRQISLAGAK